MENNLSKSPPELLWLMLPDVICLLPDTRALLKRDQSGTEGYSHPKPTQVVLRGLADHYEWGIQLYAVVCIGSISVVLSVLPDECLQEERGLISGTAEEWVVFASLK